jgi:hypothetical protein
MLEGLREYFTGNATGQAISVDTTPQIANYLVTAQGVGSNTGAIVLPIGGNIARPQGAVNGTIRYNTDPSIVSLEAYINGDWVSFFMPPATVEFVVVAGGGGGSSGGGGAGGFRSGFAGPINFTTNVRITVGAGGPVATNGNPSSIVATDLSVDISSNLISPGIVANFGGRGGINASGSGDGVTGGSGGGGSGDGWPANARLGGSGNVPATVPPQGNNGGNGSFFGASSGGGAGGGGGAGSIGGAGGQPPAGNGGGAGGAGLFSAITGTPTAYAGGGGGYDRDNLIRSGGTGGGGAGGGTGTGTAGTANTGGGGGGGGTGAAGGSGIVILAWPTSKSNVADVSSGLTYTYSETTRPGYRVFRFTAGTGFIRW